MYSYFFSLKLLAILLQQCALEHVYYEKHWSKDKISEDGRHRTSTKESIVKQTNIWTTTTPKGTLVPKALSFAPATNINNNVGLELVKPVHNFDGIDRVGGVVSTIDESIFDSLRKNGIKCFKQQETITTTVKSRIIVGTDKTHDSGPIDVGKFHVRLFYVSFLMNFQLLEYFFFNFLNRR